jgi:hypothetical protein
MGSILISVGGPFTDPSVKQRRQTYKGPVRARWQRPFLAIRVVALAILLAVSR